MRAAPQKKRTRKSVNPREKRAFSARSVFSSRPGVIGVPVGFVNVVEAKELLLESGVPCIVARGRKGGSNVAAAIVNALLYGMEGGR